MFLFFSILKEITDLKDYNNYLNDFLDSLELNSINLRVKWGNEFLN